MVGPMLLLLYHGFGIILWKLSVRKISKNASHYDKSCDSIKEIYFISYEMHKEVI